VADRGFFIVFEGGEASGKSTQATRLSALLAARMTREPGGTPLGEALRPMALFASCGAIDARTELLLMVAARAEHVARVIRPTLESGVHVVCDRFSGSTVAYQGYGRGLPIGEVIAACELATDGLQPDLNVLLDLEVGDARARRSRTEDRIEAAGSDFHHRVREGFRTIAAADPLGWAIVDASKDPDEVERAVHDVLRERLGLELA
jgi:dTMP kinase